MSLLPDYIHDNLDDIVRSEGFTDYMVTLKPGCKHGDGFLGVLTSVIINGTRVIDGDAKSDQSLYLLCKMAPTNAARRQQFQSSVTFAREVLMYNEILPLFAEFQREKGLSIDEGYKAYPKCYSAVADEVTDQYFLILEDVRPKGYTMRPKHSSACAAQAFLTVENLAKFHAISFALKDQRPDTCNDLRRVNDLLTSKFFNTPHMSKVFNSTYDRAIGALRNEDHIKIVEQMKANHVEYFNSCLTGAASHPFGIIVHGDCWNNNILYHFANGDESHPHDLYIVDYQACKYVSPVFDLFYNIFSSTDSEFRRTHYHNLLQHYHESLSNAITRLGSDPDALFTYKDLENELKRFGKYPFLIGPMQTQMHVAKSQEIADLDDFSEGIVNDEKVDFVTSYDEIEYARRINNLFDDLVQLGYWN